MATISERVADLVAPVVADLGLVLHDVEQEGAHLRVTVDREGGVDMEALAAATRAVSRALDEADPIPSAYTLEVSSPGLERKLRRPEHFALAATRVERVRVKTKPGVAGDRRVEGVVTAAGEDAVTIRSDDGSTRRLDLADIDSARTVFEWGPPPKPGSRPARSKKARAS